MASELKKKKNIKVLVVAPSRKTRGGITAVVQAYSQTPLWNEWDCYWIETHIDKGPFRKIFYFIRSFFIFLFKFSGYQAIHLHLSEPVSAIRKSFFFLPSYIFGKKIIVHFHSFSPDTTIRSKYRKLYGFLFKKSDKVVVLSQFWADAVKKEFGDKIDLSIIYNPSINVHVRTDTPHDRKNYILFAGTLNERKGFKDLIRAFSLIAAKYPGWKLIFAGNGDIDDGLSLSRELNIANQVEFLGWISGDRKNEVFENASIFCLPSYAEGFPMAVLDAMSYSIAVISTPVGGITDVFRDGVHLLIFPPGNIEALKDKLQILIDNNDMRSRLASNGNKLVSVEFSLNKIAESVDRLYQSLC